MEAPQSTVTPTRPNELTDDQKTKRRYAALLHGAKSLTIMYSKHSIRSNADIDYIYEAVTPYVSAYSDITVIKNPSFEEALRFSAIALQFSEINKNTPAIFCNSIGKELPTITFYGKDLKPKILDPVNTNKCLSELENFIIKRYNQQRIQVSDIPTIAEYSKRLSGGSKKRPSSTRRRPSRKSSATKRRRRPRRRTARK